MSDETDAKILNDVQDRFEVNVAELPDEIDISSYSKCVHDWKPAKSNSSHVKSVLCAGMIVICGLKVLKMFNFPNMSVLRWAKESSADSN